MTKEVTGLRYVSVPMTLSDLETRRAGLSASAELLVNFILDEHFGYNESLVREINKGHVCAAFKMKKALGGDANIARWL